MFAERLRKTREALSFTQEELAERAGLEVLQIWRYENNKTKPNAETIVKIARALSISTDYLLGVSDDPTPPDLDVSRLNAKERAVLSAWRRGDFREAIKVIVADE